MGDYLFGIIVGIIATLLFLRFGFFQVSVENLDREKVRQAIQSCVEVDSIKVYSRGSWSKDHVRTEVKCKSGRVIIYE